MILNHDGIVGDGISLPDDIGLFEFFKVLVYVGQGSDREMVGEEDFQDFPTDEQVIWSVVKHKGSYAEVTKILVPQETMNE